VAKTLTLFWVVTPCSSEVVSRFGGKYRLHLQLRILIEDSCYIPNSTFKRIYIAELILIILIIILLLLLLIIIKQIRGISPQAKNTGRGTAASQRS
jgi:quinol-cytochrome oxidoreductase complex cytochrome b subunit